MAWNAKPSGAYALDSQEALDNIDMMYGQLAGTWTLEAIAGMIGNMVNESGLNPWRWQSDSVSLTSDTKGYGLVQFTPAYGYINDYGPGTENFSPNLSVTSVTSGATPEDGHAQIIVIDEDRAGKYLNRARYCNYLDISSAYPFSNYKKLTDLYLATVAWLFNYEFPADRSQSVANTRYQSASYVYQYISGHAPPDPGPTPGSSRHRSIGIGIRRRCIGRRY